MSATEETVEQPAAEAAAAEKPASRPAEIGPNTLVSAIKVISAHYNGAINEVTYEMDHIVRDGSIIDFYLPGSRTRIAQGRIWVSPSVVFDKDHNGFLPIAVRDITYTPLTNTVRVNGGK